MISKIKEILGSEKCEYFSIAFLYHCCVIGLLAICFVAVNKSQPVINIIVQNEPEDINYDPIEMIDIENFDTEKTSTNNSEEIIGSDTSLSVDDKIEIPSTIALDQSDILERDMVDDINNDILSGVGDIAGKGLSQEKSTGSALDRLTVEIVSNAEHNNVHVIWLLDASISLSNQRKDIASRFNKILSELENLRNPSNIIVHSIFAFGKDCTKLCDPTEDLDTLLNSIHSVGLDLSGIENTFQSVHELVKKYGKKDPKLMVIVFTDETGDDIDWLNAASLVCRQKATPVYVVGVPAPFGKSKAQFKYVDPDPNYDQKERWVEITQGPETLYPMVLDLRSLPIDDEVLDSGFGPFALCSLCSETGGIYFSVHPDRKSTKVSKKETSPLSSNISIFFDKNDMFRYSPDYRSPNRQTQEINTHKIKSALIKACSIPIHISDEQTKTFKAFSEGQFVDEINQAQRFSAKLEPKIDQIYKILKDVEKDYDTLKDNRWRASYALAMGRILATKSRIELYNQILAEAKTGLKKKDPKTNSWVLYNNINFVSNNSQTTKNYQSAIHYLEQVIDEHPNTPWAYIADEELTTPFGYGWKENYIEPPQMGGGGGNNNPPKDDTIKKLQPKPQRKIDKI